MRNKKDQSKNKKQKLTKNQRKNNIFPWRTEMEKTNRERTKKKRRKSTTKTISCDSNDDDNEENSVYNTYIDWIMMIWMILTFSRNFNENEFWQMDEGRSEKKWKWNPEMTRTTDDVISECDSLIYVVDELNMRCPCRYGLNELINLLLFFGKIAFEKSFSTKT